MLEPKLEKALNQQINKELEAWYTYMAMAAYFDGLHLAGFSAFMDKQSTEEQAHAHRLIRYVLDRGGNIDLQAIPSPPLEYSSIRDAFNASFETEKANTRAFYHLYELAKDVNDYSTVAALQWFLDEQVEEEKVMSEALGLVDFAGDDKSALLALNQQFGGRKAEAEASTEAE